MTIFIPNCVCVLTNEKHKTYQPEFSFCRLSHDPRVGPGVLGVKKFSVGICDGAQRLRVLVITLCPFVQILLLLLLVVVVVVVIVVVVVVVVVVIVVREHVVVVVLLLWANINVYCFNSYRTCEIPYLTPMMTYQAMLVL